MSLHLGKGSMTFSVVTYNLLVTHFASLIQPASSCCKILIFGEKYDFRNSVKTRRNGVKTHQNGVIFFSVFSTGLCGLSWIVESSK